MSTTTPVFRDPVRPITDQMKEWASKLEVLSLNTSALPGGWERRTFDVDPRLKVSAMYSGGVNIGPKDTDMIVYYEQVAIIEHRGSGHIFIVFKETIDALLAQQKDPTKFPAWLMTSAVKQTERMYRYAVMKCPPTNVTCITDWLADIEEAFGPEAEWMYDALDWWFVKKQLFPKQMYGSPA